MLLSPIPNIPMSITVFAEDFYSRDAVDIEPGIRYQIDCDPKQRWKDWFVNTTPLGFFNILTVFLGQRVRKAKCFCLCGVFDKDEKTCFRIGTSFIIEPKDSKRTLYFFANDNKRAYGNNYGEITIQVTRL